MGHRSAGYRDGVRRVTEEGERFQNAYRKFSASCGWSPYMETTIPQEPKHEHFKEIIEHTRSTHATPRSKAEQHVIDWFDSSSFAVTFE